MTPDFQLFDAIGTAGFYVALDMDFLRPLREEHTIPEGWVQEYVQMGFMAVDPALRWAQTNIGVCRWSSLSDTHGVLQRAADWGLRYGACIATTSRKGMRRSYVILARQDREITDQELEQCLDRLRELHDVRPTLALTAAELEVLSALRKGDRIKSIAFALGVTEGAIKQRLRNARSKLGASTATQASMMAQEQGLI